MKFMTWNVNGIRTLTQYHPYCDDLHKNYREILEFLGADIICLQETKLSRSKLDTDIALVPGYDSYWSFHRTKSGYSGVVIYIRDHIKLLGAEEGISGILSGYIPAPALKNRNPVQLDDIEDEGDDCYGDVSEHLSGSNGAGSLRLSFERTVADTMSQFPELDNEGRGLILDFGFFVLFNLYCPNETDDQRRPFKMAYYHLLEARVRDLISRGKEVIVMGDMNVIPTELDHCDPEKWKKESGVEDFGNTEPRRPSNYGTRLDYILVTERLLPWFKSCDRQPQVVGSDHCPVVAEMAAEMAAELVLDKERLSTAQAGQEREKVLLQDILDSYGGTTDHPLAARFFDEFSGKQQKLSAFFKKPASLATTTTTPTTLDNKRSAGSQAIDIDNASRKKPFFATSSLSTLPSTPPSPGTGSQSRMSTSPLPRSAVTDSIPKPISKSTVKPYSASKKASNTVAASAKPSGQQTMLSFFGNPTKKPVKDTTPTSNNVSQQSKENVKTASQQSASSPTSVSSSLESNGFSQELPSLPTPTTASTAAPSSSSSSSTTTFSPQDYADWIPSSQEILPFTINGETTTSKWQTLFTPKTIPKCKFHNMPCTEHTVNKKGPNKGRRFYLCSL
ncbi:Class II abasic (AP) endonuclease [Mortierella sp. 14UC]|nr:Class II abasic (AP) endonuclease [Mortierella sp. 14UC]